MGIKLHERVLPVQEAAADLGIAVNKALENHELTYLELIQIINELQASWIKYAIRAERHPDDPDKGGAEA